MSLATRCPSCGTIFRVVQDQLKVSDGWVRCGQCQEVFHGIEALFDLDSDPGVAARRAARGVPAAPPPARVFTQTRGLPRDGSEMPETAAATEVRPAYATDSETQHPAASVSDLVPHPIRSPFLEEPPPGMSDPMAQPRFEPHWDPPAVDPAASGPISAPIAAPFVAPVVEPVVEPQALAQPASAQSSASTPELHPTMFDVEIPRWLRAVPVDALPQPEIEAPVDPPVPASEARRPRTLTASPPLPETADVLDMHPLGSRIFIPGDLTSDSGATTMPSMLAEDAAEDDDDEHAGPPTLASMLPEDAGEWPPRRKGRQRAPVKARPQVASASSTSTALTVVRPADPRFLREAHRGARWSQPWVRASLSLALVLLTAAAAAQVAWPQRDMLASRFPATSPAWDWLCQQAGCAIGAPHALASLALDGSSLTRTDIDHVLLFSADLHNRADHPVRMPSFDLTFMDLNGEIVARKVLSPAQIGIRQAALGADAELRVHARLQVGSLDASGFQAEMFYP